jgi:hypothetical protein
MAWWQRAPRQRDVAEAQHADREVYLLLVSAPLTLKDAAALCARALVTGHPAALRAAGLV